MEQGLDRQCHEPRQSGAIRMAQAEGASQLSWSPLSRINQGLAGTGALWPRCAGYCASGQCDSVRLYFWRLVHYWGYIVGESGVMSLSKAKLIRSAERLDLGRQCALTMRSSRILR